MELTEMKNLNLLYRELTLSHVIQGELSLSLNKVKFPLNKKVKFPFNHCENIHPN